MKLKTLIAIAAAAAFAVPLSTQAADDKASSGASGPSGSDGGAAAMFKALDKNNDGYISREEAKGTPHDKDFSTLDKDGDGKLSSSEHAAAPEHAAAGEKSSTGSSAGGTSGSAAGGTSESKGSK